MQAAGAGSALPRYEAAGNLLQRNAADEAKSVDSCGAMQAAWLMPTWLELALE